MFITKLFRVLHFLHLHYVENTCIVLGYIWDYPNVLTLGLLVALFKLTITLNHFDSSRKVFAKSEGVYHSLKYVGNIPTLTLIGDSNYHCGYSHGEILYEYIRSLHYRVLFLSMFKSFPEQKDLVIPQSIVQELRGLVDGYNSHNPYIRLSYNTALNWHLLPMACTTAISNADDLVFARNMDWVPYGDLARYSLVIHYRQSGISSFSIPGLIGTVTGWNSKGLILAMNVCKTATYSGIPAVFNNRRILENYKSVNAIKDNVKNDPSPYGAYHLTLLDRRENGLAISYYQNAGNMHLIRKLVNFKTGRNEIITYNHTYANDVTLPGGRFFSDERAIIKKENPLTPIQEIFKMYPINNWITCQTLFFYPKQNAVFIGFDNGFSATSELHYYPLQVNL